LFPLHGRTPLEIITGNTPDVSEFLEFSWYDLVWYFEPSTFPDETRNMARWIGVAHQVGQAMCYWLLPASGIPIARTSIQKITAEELETTLIKDQLNAFTESLNDKLNVPTLPEVFQLYREYRYEEDIEPDQPLEPQAMSPEIEDIETDSYDELLLTEPLLEKDGVLVRAKVIARKRDVNGNLIGNYNSNPVLNTRIYIAEFPDGHISEYEANLIPNAIYDETNDDGYQEVLFEQIIGRDRCIPEPSSMQDDTLTPDNIRKSNKYTTKGWMICISWKDGTSSWHPMSEIKNSYPL
jgi:hypothetical protein